MLSNAVQAAVSARAPKPARLRIAAQVLVSPNSNDWVWDFTIENTTAPIPADVWISLTKDEPEAQASANDQKSRSTGIGVYMARQLLRSAFGRRADIRYFLLQENYLRASLQVPVQAIAPVAPVASTASSPAAPVSASAQILYIEDNAIHAERTKDWLKTQLPSIGLAHAANVVEAQGHAKQIGPFRLVISDLTIPDGPGGQAKKNRGPQALAAVLKRGTTAPIWILTGDSWESAQKTLISYLKPDEFGYAIAPIEDQLSRLDEQKLITILPAVKSLEGGANSAPVEHALAALFHNAHHDDKAMPREPSPPNDSLSIATVNLKDGDEQNWQSAARATSGGIVVADADDIPLVDALQAWIAHEGFPELDRHQSSDPSPYPLWDSTVHRWIAMRTPSAKALSAPARYWCLRHNIIPTDLSAKECAPHWAALISEASGPLGLVRHEIANMRGAALSESALFQVVRQRVSALEDVMCFAPADEAQLDSALSSGAVARLAERLSELEARKTGDPAHLFELLEQALIDLLRRAEEVSPGEAEALRRLQHSVRAMDRLLSISGQAAS
jgi:CheY-like chemotaxis protein